MIAQGWAGENGNHNDRVLHPAQVAGGDPSTSIGEGKTRELEEAIKGGAHLGKAASRRGGGPGG